MVGAYSAHLMSIRMGTYVRGVILVVWHVCLLIYVHNVLIILPFSQVDVGALRGTI